VPVIVPAGTGALFARHGIGSVLELAPGESTQIRAASGEPRSGGAPRASDRIETVRVTATAADHEIGRRGVEAEPIGFLVEGTRRVYFAGDTDVFEGMAEIGGTTEAGGAEVGGGTVGRGRLDLALLPVWGWGPNLGPGHMNPERAAEAAALLAPQIAVPIHWGTFYPAGLARLRPRPLSGPPREFAARLRDLAPEVAVEVLAPGAALDLVDAPPPDPALDMGGS
jgi:L-ascorbate metabolism protein UlaG (beta-lactamase superfamily)